MKFLVRFRRLYWQVILPNGRSSSQSLSISLGKKTNFVISSEQFKLINGWMKMGWIGLETYHLGNSCSGAMGTQPLSFYSR